LREKRPGKGRGGWPPSRFYSKRYGSLPRSLQREEERGSALAPEWGGEGVEWCEGVRVLGRSFYSCTGLRWVRWAVAVANARARADVTRVASR
jgi:hypothetical protein